MHNSASRWTIGMALAPAALAIVGFMVMFAGRLLGFPAAVTAVGTYTALAVMFGGIVLAPGIACTIAAANLIEHSHRLGRRTAVIGLSLLAVGHAVVIYGLLAYALSTGGSAEPQSFGRPTLTEAAIIAVAFVAMILGDLYAMHMVRRRVSATS